MAGDDREREVTRLIADLLEAAGAIRRRSETVAALAGQSQARWALMGLINNEGVWTVPNAARRLGVSRQAVQRVADALRRDGLIATEPNPDHKSSPLIGLTDQGRRALERSLPTVAAWRAELAQKLAPEDMAAAQRIFSILASD
jgi:DNA-binding MarR family transcriptional regulator